LKIDALGEGMGVLARIEDEGVLQGWLDTDGKSAQ